MAMARNEEEIFMPLNDTWNKWSSSADTRAKKAIVEIIKIIINFEWEEDNEQTTAEQA
ncbi:TPA: hypothetical protein ACINQE_000164 [Streptococcus agalactiae]|uniref:hypothetical protein n=1 Tax=Streptococcus agalactiae TaxID=1311 RepID=UPI0002F6E22A|nr:hypothetical protein [Streptococcus agalactiae]HEP3841725.1 hypothetical protein [Streptococcus pyogenes]CFQ77871.1 Uncharacterised protein [Streptococcus agalactiae]CQJ46294.1 Uncharacterised protein [Streptococcus agalactiae]HEN0882693.1 hypothetical protein [Streptococcus agalactiae]HEN4393559.1 hypothetical protein [Streptococcus agalactiae]